MLCVLFPLCVAAVALSCFLHGGKFFYSTVTDLHSVVALVLPMVQFGV